MGSLRLRLWLGAIVAILAALAVAGFGLTLLFERHVLRNVADDLDVHLRQLAAGIDIDAAGRLAIVRAPADPRFADPLSGLYWQAGDDGDRLLRSRSLWDFALELPPDFPEAATLHRHELPGPGGTRLLVAERRVEMTAGGERRAIRLAVGSDLARVAAARRAFAGDLAVALGSLAAVLGLAAWVQIQLGLRPLAAIRAAIAAIRDGGPARLDTSVPIEVRPLVDEVNALLDSQERDMARARDRAADLAHGLKTPLAALAADARRLRAKGDSDIAGDIDGLAETMRRHVDRELVLARIGAAARLRAAKSTLVRPLVAGLIATLARTPIGERIAFDAQVAADRAVPFDRSDLAEVLGNLMENAARHARGRVRIRAADGARPTLTVEDDGPGVSVADRPRILERGRRLDGRGGDAGLGLAIVQDVLDAYGWRLELGDSPLGGLAATIAPAEDG
ncbi:MAG: HAMP domain-containing histidine kinase [Alphaproteobacteria bacterium]|nr:HAMP domain-containing histidine kinase [Alphaproteobacteria bacterium]